MFTIQAQAAFLAPRLLTKSLPCGIMHHRADKHNSAVRSGEIIQIQPPPSSSVKFSWYKCTKAQACAQAIGAIWRAGITWPCTLAHVWGKYSVKETATERRMDRWFRLLLISSRKKTVSPSQGPGDGFYIASMWKGSDLMAPQFLGCGTEVHRNENCQLHNVYWVQLTSDVEG